MPSINLQNVTIYYKNAVANERNRVMFYYSSVYGSIKMIPMAVENKTYSSYS